MKQRLKNILTLFLIVIIFALLFSCDSWPLEHFVDEETKTYCYFKNGILYTFKDSVTGISEEIKISNEWNITTHGTPSCPGQRISSSILINNEQYGQIFIVAAPFRSECYDNDTSYSLTKIYGNSWLEGVQYCSIESNQNNNCFPDYEKCELVNTFSEIQINGNTYFNIKKFALHDFHYIDSTYTHYDSIIGESYSYWAKNVGLIRFEFYHDSITIVKNLESYQTQ